MQPIMLPMAYPFDSRPPPRTADMHELAREFQQALDSGRGSEAAPGADSVGWMLLCIVLEQTQPEGTGRGRIQDVLEPIITGTTLATSMVRYLERIPWAEVTPQMLRCPAGTPLYVAEVCGEMLWFLCESANLAAADSGSSPLPANILRQVRTIPTCRSSI